MRITTREVLDREAFAERRNRPRISLVTRCRDCGWIIDEGQTYCEGCTVRHQFADRTRRAAHDPYQRRLVP